MNLRRRHAPAVVETKDKLGNMATAVTKEAVEKVEIGSELQDPHLWAERFGDYLLRFASYRVRRREIAEELVQETFLSAWRSRSGFEGRSSLKTWLVTILKNKIIDYYEKTSREGEVGSYELPGDSRLDQQAWERPEVAAPEAMLGRETPESLFERQELLQRVAKQLESLPQKMKRAFVSRVFEEIPAETLCQELGCSESNLWVMVYRAREKLRLCVEV